MQVTEVEAVRRGRRRHLFALQGDLRLIDADAFLIPTDSYGSVEDHWAWAVGVDRDGRTRQLRQEERLLEGEGHAWVDEAPAGLVLAVNVAGGNSDNDVASMIRRLAASFGALEERGLRTRFRSRPLVAMPLVGVGRAGLGGRTGEVIASLLDAIDDHFDGSPAGGFDLVIVTRDSSSIAALQHERRTRFSATSTGVVPEWLERLVAAGRAGELAVMFGAGASAALGLPMWDELLRELVRSLDDPGLSRMDLTGLDPTDAATLLIEAGGTVWFSDALARLLATPRHSLTHGLIANLRCPLTITTNYDQAFELAAESITGSPVAVLPWDEDSGAGTRVLKLHGDLTRGQLVLSRDQFVAMHAFRRPLAGVLQSRMLIGHLLAVGTSMSDSTLVHAAEEFRALIVQAQRAGGTPGERTGGARAGTAVLTSSDPARVRLLDRSFTVVEGDLEHGVRESARDVDVLLDWIAMQASSDLSFALDARYRALLSPADQDLAARLMSLAGTGAQGHPSSLRSSVEAYLESLGASGVAPPSTIG
jgi:hypothetical protein